MNPNKALWEKGDFTQIAASMRASGEGLVRSLEVAGLNVLDVGCGDGTTALPAASLGAAKVVGVDISAPLVAAGNARARAAGVSDRCVFREGDAVDLRGIEDQSFDLVVSIFGAMFAPKPFDVAKSLVRVARRGGRIVMGNWIPGDPTLVAQLLKISSAYAPPPPEGFVSPMTWGVESHVIERFTAAGIPEGRIACTRDTFVFELDEPPSALVTRFRTYYGPTMNAFEAAEKDGRQESLAKELTTLFENHNESGTPDRTRIPATFLRVTVSC